MSDIKIFVTHISNRDDEIIDNPLFVNVIAGAHYQTKPFPESCIPDNTGINISHKNKAYCELSTQYWAWKNVEADYYGFCHYRRFLSLTDKKYKSNDQSGRGQVCVKILNKATSDYFQLSNAVLTQKFIENYDCILPQRQNLSKLPTPKGKQKNVYKHFEAHDRFFMNGDDLKILISTISDLHPEYLHDAKEFLKKPFFWGYNCFVLKKQLFFELCEFEFDIIEELEKRIDTAEYNTQMARMPGFMGEILSCIYFYHLIKRTPSLKLAEVQLIYFEKTEKSLYLRPQEQNSTAIAFYLDQVPPFLLLPTLNSFLTSISKGKTYDIIILHWNISKAYLKYFKNLAEQRNNIKVNFVDLYDIKNTLMELNLPDVDARILLPWIIPEFDKILCFNWNVLFKKELVILENIDFNGHLVVGSKDILRIGLANDITDKYEKRLKKDLGIEDINSLASPYAFILNLFEIRKKLMLRKIFQTIKEGKKNWDFCEQLNLIYHGEIHLQDFRLNYYYTEDPNELRIIKQAPVHAYNEYVACEDQAITVSYSPSVLWSVDGSEFNVNYWKNIKESDFYHLFITHFSVLVTNSSLPKAVNKPLYKKLIGGIKCIKDHGFLYTFQYALRRLGNI